MHRQPETEWLHTDDPGRAEHAGWASERSELDVMSAVSSWER